MAERARNFGQGAGSRSLALRWTMTLRPGGRWEIPRPCGFDHAFIAGARNSAAGLRPSGPAISRETFSSTGGGRNCSPAGGRDGRGISARSTVPDRCRCDGPRVAVRLGLRPGGRWEIPRPCGFDHAFIAGARNSAAGRRPSGPAISRETLSSTNGCRNCSPAGGGPREVRDVETTLAIALAGRDKPCSYSNY